MSCMRERTVLCNLSDDQRYFDRWSTLYRKLMLEDERVKHPLLGEVRLARKLFTKNILYDLKVKNFTEVQHWQQRNKHYTAAATCGLFLPESVELL